MPPVAVAPITVAVPISATTDIDTYARNSDHQRRARTGIAIAAMAIGSGVPAGAASAGGFSGGSGNESHGGDEGSSKNLLHSESS